MSVRKKAAKAAMRGKVAAAAATTNEARAFGVAGVTGIRASKAGAPSIAEILSSGKPSMRTRVTGNARRIKQVSNRQVRRASSRAAQTRAKQMKAAMPGRVRRLQGPSLASMNRSSRLIAAGGVAALGAGALINRSGPAADKPVGRPTGMFEF